MPKYQGVDDLKEMFRKAKGARDRYLPDWTLSVSYFMGDQWVRWVGGRLDKPRLHDWRVQMVDNRILPVITHRVARKVKNRPVFTGTPFDDSEDAIRAAGVVENILEVDWQQLDLTRRLYGALLWADICTAGFWKVYWDSTQGETVEILYDGEEPMRNENGVPMKAEEHPDLVEAGATSKPLSQGDVCVEVISPFELFPDPLATSLTDAEWVIEQKIRSPEYILKRYGKKIEPDAEAPMGPMESHLFSSLYYPGGGTSGEYVGVKLHELWMRPCTDYPKGKRCVWAGNEILYEDEEPFDPMPYVMFGGVRAPGRFWPTSITSQLRGPQTELNKIESQIQENANRIGNPSLLASEQSDLKYTGKPGEIVKYNAAMPDSRPEFLQPPEVPIYVKEQVERISESMTEISGLHEVSKATVPSGVTAASAINLLQEADDTRIGPEIQEMEVALGEAGTKILRLRAQFNDDARILRIAGEDGAWNIFTFRKEMLGKEPRIEVQAGSGMPRSKAAKQAAMQEILQLALQSGLPINPRDLRRYFKDFEVGALEKLFDTISADEMQVQREHRQMGNGAPVDINEWDDDNYHVTAHDDFRKSGMFAEWPDEAKELLGLHVQAHRERMKQAVDMQVAAQVEAQQKQMQLQLASGQAEAAQDHAQKLEQQQQQAALQRQNGGGNAS